MWRLYAHAHPPHRYKVVISDITAKMGAGMASYIEASTTSPLSMRLWQDYDLYCHFVAGVVGEGLSRLFSESGVERAWLGDQLSLSNHMGLFLQKTNIIRDYAEDCAEGRHFWPKECWAAPGADFASQADVAKGIVETSKGSGHYRPEGKEGERAMFVLSTMLLDAVRHSTRALDYLSLLREQSIFNFCAIPQVMAIATLNVMMGNPDVFRRNVKIRKSQAVQLILRAMNPRDVSYMFLEFAREMRTKLSSKDPNFVKWSIELSKVSGAGNRGSSTGGESRTDGCPRPARRLSSGASRTIRPLSALPPRVGHQISEHRRWKSTRSTGSDWPRQRHWRRAPLLPHPSMQERALAGQT